MVKVKAFPKHSAPHLIVSWSPDAGETGWWVNESANKILSTREFAEIEPLGFFSLGGIEVRNNVSRFPESKFYSFEEKDLIFFKSNIPATKGYKFLTLVLDVARSFNVKEVYTIGGIIAMKAHTDQKKVIAVVNAPHLKEELSAFDLDTGFNYQGTTSMNGFLLWVGKEKGVPATALLAQIPFYLADKKDPRAGKALLSFLNLKFGLEMDLSGFDRDIEMQDRKIARIRENNANVDKYIGKLEQKIDLSQEEIENFVNELNNSMS